MCNKKLSLFISTSKNKNIFFTLKHSSRLYCSEKKGAGLRIDTEDGSNIFFFFIFADILNVAV